MELVNSLLSCSLFLQETHLSLILCFFDKFNEIMRHKILISLSKTIFLIDTFIIIVQIELGLFVCPLPQDRDCSMYYFSTTSQGS